MQAKHPCVLTHQAVGESLFFKSFQIHVLGADLRPFLSCDQASSWEFAWAVTHVLPSQHHHLLYMTRGAPLALPSQAGVMGVWQSSSPTPWQAPHGSLPLCSLEQGCQAETLSAPVRVAVTARASCSTTEWGENRKQVVTHSPHSPCFAFETAEPCTGPHLGQPAQAQASPWWNS